MPDGRSTFIEVPDNFDLPMFRRPQPAGSGLVRLTPEEIRRQALARAAASSYAGPSGTPIQQPPIQTTQALQKFSSGREVGNYDPIYYAPQPLLQQLGTAARQAGIPQIAGAVDMLNLMDTPGSEYRRHITLYPEDKNLPMGEVMKRIERLRGKVYVPKPGEFGVSEYPESGVSYSDYVAGRGKKSQDYGTYGTTALSGTQGSSTQQQQKTNRQRSAGSQSKTQQPASTPAFRPQVTTNAKPNTNKASVTQSSNSSTTMETQSPATQKSAPVAQAEPSGEALSYFRKNKQSAGWDALGTAVSLVQRSLSPDKGGLKSRAEYDRLLRGSENFKKLDGDEQQRVRQAFAQWMNEQTIFKGKA